VRNCPLKLSSLLKNNARNFILSEAKDLLAHFQQAQQIPRCARNDECLFSASF